jgi:hypothetical protein
MQGIWSVGFALKLTHVKPTSLCLPFTTLWSCVVRVLPRGRSDETSPHHITLLRWSHVFVPKKMSHVWGRIGEHVGPHFEQGAPILDHAKTLLTPTNSSTSVNSSVYFHMLYINVKKFIFPLL